MRKIRLDLTQLAVVSFSLTGGVETPAGTVRATRSRSTRRRWKPATTAAMGARRR